MSNWKSILPDVFMFEDSCNVYAINGPEGCAIIDSGTGLWLEHLHQLPQRPRALLCTHFFRDHSAGAAKAARRGIPVFVPQGEQMFFEEPQEHFRRRETYLIYDNLWDLHAPVEGISASGALRDYDRVSLCGIEFEVMPLPGASVGQIGLACRIGPGREKVVFCGETIHSAGKVPRVAPYQYNYLDLNGGYSAYFSLNEILRGEFSAGTAEPWKTDCRSRRIRSSRYQEEPWKHACRPPFGTGEFLLGKRVRPAEQYRKSQTVDTRFG